MTVSSFIEWYEALFLTCELLGKKDFDEVLDTIGAISLKTSQVIIL